MVSNRKRKRLLSFPCICRVSAACFVVSIFILIFLNIFLPISPLPPRRSSFGSTNLDSRICEIPKIPLRSEAYIEKVVSVPKISNCHDSPLTKLMQNGTLQLLRPDLYTRNECTAYEIDRPEELSNDRHSLRQCVPFDERNQIHSITSEYVMVACGSQTLEYSYHRQILPSKESIHTKLRHWEDERGQVPMSVMVLVLDSTSAVEASRNLPMTMDFLLSQLNFIQFSKFHSLGEPTMSNVIPLLTGTHTKTLFKERKWLDQWDNVDFIWREFQISNYVTAYIEDIPFLGTFNYGLQVGFLSPPTDIYPRPLFTAWELNKKEKQKCIGDSSLWKFIFDYQLDILRTFDGIAPTFTMPWLAWPFHEYFGTLSSLDVNTLSFFQDLAASPSILENTLLIVMADHGFYNHDYANTHEGLLERRLPLFLMRVPKILSERIPNIFKIVSSNAEQVTSHYDVYQTLLHVSQMSTITNVDEEGDKWTRPDTFLHGHSLIKQIPEGRTCRETGIPDTWCACNLPPPPPSQTVIPENILLDVHPFHLFRLRDLIG